MASIDFPIYLFPRPNAASHPAGQHSCPFRIRSASHRFGECLLRPDSLSHSNPNTKERNIG